MKKNKIMILGALLLTLVATSCHEDADPMVAYAFTDNQSWAEAEKSYAGKFRVFWKAMNQNYTLWDYEKECGLDWDEVYEKYLPKFEALDEPGTEVSDSVLEALMTEVVAPLHDGHMSVTFTNHQTKNNVRVSPGMLRFKERDDYKVAQGFSPDLRAYYMNNQLRHYQTYDCTAVGLLRRVALEKGLGLDWARTRLKELENLSRLTDGELKEMVGLSGLVDALEKLFKKDVTKAMVNEYNTIVTQYAYLNVPFLEPVNTAFVDYGIRIQYALTTDNIAYLNFSMFGLSTYLIDAYFNDMFPNATAREKEIRDHVQMIWNAWFDNIQKLHKSGKLNGVIIDVRSNPGGMISDARFVFGALMPAGDLQYGWARYKRGVGRYDYTPLMPKMSFTMQDEHEIIDDKPIVVMANGFSVSMAEMTSLSAKVTKNATLIGKRTFGGLCALNDNSNFSDYYAGHIGVSGVTPVYVYLPTECIFDIDKKPLDGIGVTPDIEVDFNEEQFKATGNDSQFDRALEFIRTGK